MRRRLAAASFAVAAVAGAALLLSGCPEERRRRIVPGGTADVPERPTELSVEVSPRPPGDGPVWLVVLSWDPEDMVGGRPRPMVKPRFSWRSEGLDREWPIRLAVPLPPDSATSVVWDANSNGRIDQGELITDFFEAPPAQAPGEVLAVVLDRPFLGDPGPGRDHRSPQ